MSNIIGKLRCKWKNRKRHVKKSIYKKFRNKRNKRRGARQNSLTFLFAGGAGGRGATQHPKIYNIFFCGH